ncbi:hypothetical protein N1027_10505 [Herbiconiux sp. CPCC 205763]|uniref:Uncharacterized protein n=1 Tax=Herbiconiux aconitum TaxID=2970913 RepID=A0ABT2GUE6_9MICO|nr:hypothetical protein [Herbiconiux aconitum]MCS5718564.1 hypothetical protein [Herbiconiux aconitum]
MISIVWIIAWVVGRRKRAVTRLRADAWITNCRREAPTLEALGLVDDSGRFDGTLGIDYYFILAVENENIEFWSGGAKEPFCAVRRPLAEVDRFEVGSMPIRVGEWPVCVIVFKGESEIRVPVMILSTWGVLPAKGPRIAQVVEKLEHRRLEATGNGS